MKTSTALRALLGTLCALAAGTALAAPDLPFSYETDLYDYDILFDMSNPYDCTLEDPPMGADLNYLPFNQALNLVLALDSGEAPVPGTPAGYHDGYTSFDFRAPDFNGEGDEVLVYNCSNDKEDDNYCDNGQATSTRIIMPAQKYCDESEHTLRAVIGHELFHHVQGAYGASSTAWGKALFEGTARMMQDEIYSDLDGDTTTFASYWNQVKKYMNDPNREFWTLEYTTALGWKYASERFGETTDEPQVGVDFIRRLWENVGARSNHADVPAVLEETIQNFDTDATLRDWFRDFTIANVAREFDASGLPDAEKYSYIDEHDGHGIAYTNVHRNNVPDGGSPPQIPGETSANDAVVPWGAEYLEATVGSSCGPGLVLGYRMTGIDDARGALLAIDESGRIARLVRGGSEEFAAAFVQRSSPDRYDRLIAVATGGDEQDAFGYHFDCGTGSLDVRAPDSIYKAYVGAGSSGNFIVRMRILGPASLGEATVLGMQPQDFEVYVGTEGVAADRATVVSGAYVQGEYWLTVTAPAKPDTATYDLHVTSGVLLGDSQTGAVSYEKRILDQVLVIDRSGSMNDPAESPKIDAAKNAARLYADIVASGDRVGLISFSGDGVEPNDDATTDEILGAANESHRDDVKDAIDAIDADGNTSIGDGLARGAAEFPIHGSTTGEDWIVLLSDGMENEGQFWTQVENSIKSAGIRVSTIALGDGADQVLLQEIAHETNGEYYYVDTGSVGTHAGTHSGTGDSIALRLADVLLSASTGIRQTQRLWEESATLGSPADRVISVSGGGISSATFVVDWDGATGAVGVQIERPDGSIVTDGVAGAQIYSDSTHVVASVGTLGAGDWTVHLTPTSGSPRYLAVLTGRDTQGPELRLSFGQFMDSPPAQSQGALFLRGLPQPIVAQLADNHGIVLGAQVRARIEHPDTRVIEMPLYDDGDHGDGFPNDGIYGNIYRRTTVASYNHQPDTGSGPRGSYDVRVEATGTDNLGHAFTRIRAGAFQVFETDHMDIVPPPDTDGDGMPDRYEVLHECLDEAVADGNVDADGEGLSNVGEWTGGTDPCHPDTDRGGESDGSEVSHGANPFDPADDALPRPIDAEVVDYLAEHLTFPAVDELQPNANLIRYQVNPVYDQVKLLRSTSINGPFSVVATFPAVAQGGTYSDAGLVNGTTYFYKVQPQDLNGRVAAPSHVFSGTPNAHPIPPIGSVNINAGQPFATSVNAKLRLDASTDTTEVMISGNSRFPGAAWEPFVPGAHAFTLTPDASGIASVYVKYRDADGNESPTVYTDSIEVVPANTVGNVKGTVLLADALGGGAHGQAAILVQPVGRTGVPPAFSKSSGAVKLPNVEPGNYDLVVSYTGYAEKFVGGVVVAAGQVTDIGTITLEAEDADADGVFDLVDNCTNVPNADQRDSNADGFGNACDADFNDDCVANFLDLGYFKSVFLSDDADADMNGDGFVNFLDLGSFKASFLQPPGPSGATNACQN